MHSPHLWATLSSCRFKWIESRTNDEDQIALVIPHLSNFVAHIPVILGTPTISHIVNVIKEMEIDAQVNTLGKWPGGLSFSSLMSYSHSGR